MALISVIFWIVVTVIACLIASYFGRRERERRANLREVKPTSNIRSRCNACGEIYFGDICPMCGKEF